MPMAKVALTAALLVAMVAFATATTFTTTIITTTIDDEANPQHQQCQKQIQGRQFQSCQKYIKDVQSPYNGEEEDVLELSTENFHPASLSFRGCCDELRNINPQCRCEAMKHTVRQRGSFQGQQMEKVYQIAQDIPSRCFGQTQQQCQIRAIFV